MECVVDRLPTGDWPEEWVRGFTEFWVLRAISDGPTYGYAIAARLGDAGLGTLKGGTLYPLLGRLERTGLLSTCWAAGDGGPGRKFYELTSSGRARLWSLMDSWAEFARTVAAYLDGPGPEGRHHE